MGYSSMSEDLKKPIEKLQEEGNNDFIVNYHRMLRIDELKKHPNYKDTYPYPDEDIISFTLRTCAHLVSPPQEPGESYEVECLDIRDGILALKEEIKQRFNNNRNIE